VKFTHDSTDYVYVFHRYDSGQITFKRLWPAAQDGEITIYWDGKKDAVDTIVIVLYKAAKEEQDLKGFQSNVMRKILNLYSSKEELEESLQRAIISFGEKFPIAKISDVMDFANPYSPWTAHPINLEEDVDLEEHECTCSVSKYLNEYYST